MRTRLLTVAAIALSCVLVTKSWAGTEKVIYTFTGGTDGAYPETTLVKSGGDLYGTTGQGGAYGEGTVFRLQHGASGWTETVLYSFTGGTDGAMPSGNIAVDKTGNVYGVTGNGGSNYKGNVYEVSPTGGGWVETVLYNFTGGSDGAYPFGGVALDKLGNLYGTANEGGSMSDCMGVGCGVVFELMPGSAGWTEVVLYAFTGVDGAFPQSPIVMDAAGNLYGTIWLGGTSPYCTGSANGCGVVFKLTNSKGQWTETVLHDFYLQGGGSDGVNPYAVTLHGGNLYGTTFGGGTAQDGTVFDLIGAKAWKEQVLHSFSGGKDGSYPSAGVVLDKAGDLYGTTRNGGGAGQCYEGCGVVYELKPSAHKWTEKVVYRFTGGNDGAGPATSLTLGAAGKLYGTASGGGADDKGVAFELAVGASTACALGSSTTNCCGRR